MDNLLLYLRDLGQTKLCIFKAIAIKLISKVIDCIMIRTRFLIAVNKNNEEEGPTD